MNFNIHQILFRPKSIAPLITFRILFGGLMMVGALRFMLKGWIERLYVEPQFFFKFYGFEWVNVIGETGMYLLYSLIALSAALIMLGFFYRLATIIFFLSFTYSELIDSTNYLNHYYLVCLLALLLIFLPAHRAYSVDVWRKPKWRLKQVSAWTINVLILQICIVYFCAGIAKLNTDWLFRAMPMAIWLPARADWPILGTLFAQSWSAYAFSWAGAIYDLTIPFFLLHPKTRPFAYVAVIIFHVLTKLLFNIGLFPFIMIFNTLIFFSGAWHERIFKWIGYKVQGEGGWSQESKIVWPKAWRPFFRKISFKLNNILSRPATNLNPQPAHPHKKSALLILLSLYFLIQLLLPFRHHFYPGHLLWTEEGYRFSWRVMLVEKTGQATFYVHDPVSQRKTEVDNSIYLTEFQEKQMAIQPDMILQYAHFLAKEYQDQFGINSPKVTVDSYVALNGRRSQRFINPNTDLAAMKDTWAPKQWIIPFKYE